MFVFSIIIQSALGAVKKEAQLWMKNNSLLFFCFVLSYFRILLKSYTSVQYVFCQTGGNTLSLKGSQISQASLAHMLYNMMVSQRIRCSVVVPLNNRAAQPVGVYSPVC